MRTFFCALLILAAGFSGYSQQHEIGIMGGASYYIGDLNPNGHFMQSKPAGGIMYRYNMNPRMALRVQALFGSLQAADSVIRFNEDRNLSFRSPLMELGAQYELSYYKFKIGSEKDYFTPYLFVGASFFKFNPQGFYKGDWYNLQSLGTEGQGTTAYPDRDPYSLAGFAIPFGAGFKIILGNATVLGFEWGLRKTFTDYIDDVSTTYADPAVLMSQNTEASAALADPSNNTEFDRTGFQRGNAATKDWYSFAGITLTVKFADKGDSCHGTTSRRGSKKQKYFRILKTESDSSN
jgi:hypothetical protein